MAREHTRNHGTTIETVAPVSLRNLETAAAWDRNAEARAGQIVSGRDLSRDFAILPGMFEAVAGRQYEDVLDIGTGDGEFLSRLRARGIGRHLVGIDVSPAMIHLAQSRYQDISTRFLVLEAERAVDFFGPGSFQLVTANMVFNTAPDLKGIIDSVGQVLKKCGVFVFSLVHPRFFHLMQPLKRYLPPDFSASRESDFVVPFTISLDPKPLPSPIPFFHRPISTYLRLLHSAQLVVTDFIEPLPKPNLDPNYLDNWRVDEGFMLPRFLILRAEKIPC